MTITSPSMMTSASAESGLTLAVLQQQNEFFRGSGGVSMGNRSLGFRPSFYDMETGEIHPSRFANGLEAPLHVLDGLPDDLVVSRQENGRVTEVKPSVIAGFTRQGHFFTRKQAAQATAQMHGRSQILSNPQKNNQLLYAWENFVLDQDYPGDLLRPVVEDSWWRCQQSRVDPELRHAPIISDREQLEARRHQQADLLKAAHAVLQRAGELLSYSHNLILLADADGLILDVKADLWVRNSAGTVNLIEGGLWGESAVGTNSIGTAIATGQPVQLYGAEHFCAGIKHWTCSADVIRDPHDGRILGAVDISSLTDAYQRRNLVYAIAVARAIESNLAADYFKSRERVIEGTRDLFRRWQTEGLLAFDRRGRLVKANQQAYRLLPELDADLALTPQTRLPALDLEVSPSPARVPSWLKSQLRQSIQLRDQKVGTLVILSSLH